MKLTFLNRIMLAMLMLVATVANANDLGALPRKLRFESREFLNTVVSYDRAYNIKILPKVCACQLLTVKNKNKEIDNVAVFSEKINNGDLTADFDVAVKVLEQEKKHMKSFFYDKVTVIGRQLVATDCKTFYNQLKVQYTDLKMYELLDADAISRFNNLNK